MRWGSGVWHLLVFRRGVVADVIRPRLCILSIRPGQWVVSYARSGWQDRPTRQCWRVDMRRLWCTAMHGVILGVGLISTVLPTAAYACAVCGGAEDNGYFWGMLFLMSMPFTVVSLVGGWLLYSYRRAQAGPATSTPILTAEQRTPRPISASSASERHDDRR